MAMETLPVISDEEIQPTLHKGRPDAPMLGTTGMQELMDAHPNLNSRYIALLAETLNRNLQNVLAKDNTEPYEPQGPYQPVTLQMLQEAVFNSGGGDMNTLDYDPTNQRRDIYAQATEAQRGMAAIATDAEAEAGTDGQKIMTPRTVKGVVDDAMERAVQVGDIVTTIRQLPDGQYVPCAGQELDTGEYPETAGLQKTPVVFALASNTVGSAIGVRLIGDGKGLAGVGGSSNARLYYTENYGENWTEGGLGTSSGNSTYPLYVWPDGKALVARNGTLFYTNDFKGEWTNTLITNYIPQILPDGHGIVSVTGSTPGLYYTSNYGASWTRSNITVYGYGAITLGGRGFAYSNNNILYTTANHGQLWSAQGSSGAMYSNIALKDNGRGLCKAGTVWQYTTNYGTTWTPCAGLPNGDSAVFTLLDDGYGALAQQTGTVTTPYYTNDYGATWTQSLMEPLETGETLPSAIAYASPIMLASFGGGLLRTNARTLYTRDFGRSWARLSDVSLPPFLLDSGRGILGGQYTCNFKLIAPVQANGYMKVRIL